MRCQQRNDGLALSQLAIQCLLPVASGFDPSLGVEIQEERNMPLGLEPGLHCSSSGILTAVANKDGCHRVCLHSVGHAVGVVLNPQLAQEGW
jgi:hypothetical protein